MLLPTSPCWPKQAQFLNNITVVIIPDYSLMLPVVLIV